MPKKSKPKSAKSRKSAQNPRRIAQRALAFGTNAKNSIKARVKAMADVPLAMCEDDKSLQTVLKILREEKEPIEVRLAALQALQAASFSVVAFESCRADYTATLRAVAADKHLELRQRVLGILAREKDGFAQKKLLEGLQQPDKALLPPEKALQLLSYDVHAEAYPVARAIVGNPPNATAKREALRLLAADANAAPTFEKVLRDKKETSENRQISAAALQAIKPDKLRTHAREILLDTSENDEIQATCLTALKQFGDQGAIASDNVLLRRVKRLGGKGSSVVKQSARQFLSKYGQ